MMATSINYEGLPPVAQEFDAATLRANILDSQRNGQSEGVSGRSSRLRFLVFDLGSTFTAWLLAPCPRSDTMKAKTDNYFLRESFPWLAQPGQYRTSRT
jgi:hypothetical protein